VSVDAIRQLVGPPTSPIDAPDAAGWVAVEARLGVRLPTDYKRFVSAYGSGSFDDFRLQVLNFAAPEDWESVTSDYQPLLDEWVEMEMLPPGTPVFPQSGGALTWGTNGFGDTLVWMTEGEPDSWPTVAYPSEFEDGVRFDLPATDLVASFLNGQSLGALSITLHAPHVFEPSVR